MILTSFLVLAAAVAVWGLWAHYMVSPWTRDGQVRVVKARRSTRPSAISPPVCRTLTACLPMDWEHGATISPVPGADGVSVLCSSPTEIALSKLCAWREKDIDWLRNALLHGIVDVEAMRLRHSTIDNPQAPAPEEILSRIGLVAPSRPKGG